MAKTLYQKYRPQNFNEVVGQNFIVDVLKNSIKTSNIQSSYIFNGPRGTGKTSLARIFAKAINCNDIINPLQDNCEICQYFKNINEYEDILELDAASNNGVEDVRKIIENSYFQPIKLKYKVYIIDEIHMFSKGAFNALLKTLEDPPPNVVFILATTEINKIPPTILSRCQRFDFKRVGQTDMQNLLKDILNKENIDYEIEALNMIYTFSDGCVRDALSLTQKMIIGSQKINKQVIQEKLNILSDEKYENIYNLLLEKDPTKVVAYWNELYENGINEILFIQEFQRYLKEKILNDIVEKNDKKELIYIISQINELEHRSIYSTNINNIIQVCFLNIILNIDIKEMKKKDVKPEFDSHQEKIISKINNKKEEEKSITNIEKSTKRTVNKEEKPNYNKDEIYRILSSATKSDKNKIIGDFSRIAEKLSIDKLFGLAKFFNETKVKAASEFEIIVTIDDSYLEAYLQRHDDLIKNLETIQKIIILTEKEWIKVRKEYIDSLGESTANEKTELNPIKKLLEKKLETDVKIINEE